MRWSSLLCAWVVLYGVAVSFARGEQDSRGGAGKGGAVVPAVIQFADGNSATYDLANEEIGIRTGAGVIPFKAVQLRSIRWGKDAAWDSRSVIETVYGDAWYGTLENGVLEYRAGDKPGQLKLAGRPVQGVTFPGNAGLAPETALPRHATVKLTGGEQVHVDLQDLRLRVRNSAGDWQLPLGCAAKVSFRSNAVPAALKARIVFPSGLVQEPDLVDPKGSIEAVDLFGHRLKIRLGAVSTIEVADAGPFDGEPGPQQGGNAVRAVSEKGVVTNIQIQMAVWSAKTAVGPVHVPSPMALRIERGKGGKYERIVTAHGDVFYGALQPSVLDTSAVDAKGRRVPGTFDVNLQAQVRFQTPALDVPPGWPRWNLASGDSFSARPVSPVLRMVAYTDKRNIAVDVDDINSVARLDVSNFSIETRSGGLRMAVPADESIELVLLCDGSRRRIKWDQVDSVTRQRTASPAEESARTPDETPRLLPENDKPAPIDVKTAFGRLSISPSHVAGTVVDSANRLCLLRTVFGGTIVAVDWDKRLERMGTAETPPRKGVSVRKLSPAGQAGTIPADYLAWQLSTGDRFYARISTPRDLSAGRVTSIYRTAKGELVAKVGEKGLETSLPESSIDICLLSTTSASKLPLSLVERAEAGTLSQLPPLAEVIRGADEFLADTVFVPGGAFKMGRDGGFGMDDELPAHQVTVGSFRMDRAEITRAQFAAFVERTGYETTAERAGRKATWRDPGFEQSVDEPVVSVSWFDAVEFCNWRSEAAGLDPCYDVDRKSGAVSYRRGRNGYRLPTEAEWEYAARAGGKDIAYPWGNDDPTDSTNEAAASALEFPANCRQRTDGVACDVWVWTSPVKALKPNALGLYAMAGNAWEWCQDWYLADAYRTVHVRQPVDPCVESIGSRETGSRVMRGGSFENDLDSARCVSRGSGIPLASASRVGFRCVRNSE